MLWVVCAQCMQKRPGGTAELCNIWRTFLIVCVGNCSCCRSWVTGTSWGWRRCFSSSPHHVHPVCGRGTRATADSSQRSTGHVSMQCNSIGRSCTQEGSTRGSGIMERKGQLAKVDARLSILPKDNSTRIYLFSRCFYCSQCGR